MNGRLTITEVAKSVGVTPRTIMRWEKSGKIRKPKRDWRGWRFYYKEDIGEIKKFYETSYEFDEANGIAAVSKGVFAVIFILAAALPTFTLCRLGFAETSLSTPQALTETPSSIDINLEQLPVVGEAAVGIAEPVKYTLGPNDVLEIEVRRHPEFSGQYTVNSEGKIEYKFVGDIVVEGLTKLELKQRLTELLCDFIVEPDIDVRIAAYLSKVFYVVGDVSRPGKFYMRGNNITVREALIQSGLPTQAAAMQKCRLITPNAAGKNNYAMVNAYRLLYEGDLKCNLEMQPGDVLYVPATVMAKIIRVISPVSGVVGQTTGVARNSMNIIP